MKLFTLLYATAGLSGASAGLIPVPDVPFVQEYHEACPFEAGGDANDVRAVAVDADDGVWAATKGGLYVLRAGKWTQQPGVTTGRSTTCMWMKRMPCGRRLGRVVPRKRRHGPEGIGCDGHGLVGGTWAERPGGDGPEGSCGARGMIGSRWKASGRAAYAPSPWRAE